MADRPPSSAKPRYWRRKPKSGGSTAPLNPSTEPTTLPASTDDASVSASVSISSQQQPSIESVPKQRRPRGPRRKTDKVSSDALPTEELAALSVTDVTTEKVVSDSTTTTTSKTTPQPRASKTPRVPKESGRQQQQPKPRRSGPRQPVISEDSSELTQSLQRRLTSDEYECMVCYEPVKRSHQVWPCDHCYAIFHIKCIRSWSTAQGASGHEWRCPGCQTAQHKAAESRCFCGSARDPAYDPYAPHSCGESCHRKRINGCPHACPLQCHPGPCPPCSALAQPTPCNCGKTVLQIRCGSRAPLTCGNVCGKALSCGKHQCQSLCHVGECAPCDIKVDMSCFCNHETKTFSCGAVPYSCEGVCDHILDCGNHKCERVCHAGPCDPCWRTPERLTQCPCGKASIPHGSRLSCVDPVPTCGQVCGRSLPCGHSCKQACHIGACAPCTIPVTRPCRCGAEQRETTCGASNQVLCHRVCTVLRDCGRHRCDTQCCVILGQPHECHLVCNKPNKCGSHKCQMQCHRGRCPPCLSAIFTELSCRCGKTVLLPPQPCGTEVPVCIQPCSIPRACGHAPHHTCHMDDKCSPCPVLVSRMCAGGHEVRHNIRCGQTVVLCGHKCGKPLRCNQHVCERDCHAGPCVKSYPQGKGCGRECGIPRACGHKCHAPCHAGEPCADIDCHEMSVVYCACKRREGKIPCGSKVDVLPCDDECEQAARTRAFASALGLMPQVTTSLAVNSNLRAVDEATSRAGFDPELVEMARLQPHFIASVEKTFAEFIHSKDSEYAMKPMPTDERRAVHLLGQYYGITTVSRGFEGARYVALQTSERTRIPRVLLSFFSDVLRTHILRLRSLTVSVRTSDIARPLQNIGLQNHTRVVWLNDTTALVICDAPDVLTRARTALQPLFSDISIVEPETTPKPLEEEPVSTAGDDVWAEESAAEMAATTTTTTTSEPSRVSTSPPRSSEVRSSSRGSRKEVRAPTENSYAALASISPSREPVTASPSPQEDGVVVEVQSQPSLTETQPAIASVIADNDDDDWEKLAAE